MEINKRLYRIACPLCGNKDLKLLSKQGQFGPPTHVSICPYDGLVFLSPRWSKSRYIHFYTKDYDAHYRARVLGEESDTQKYKNIKLICDRLNKYALLEQRESVLDVGAGMGWSLWFLKSNYSHFKRFAAIEATEHCIKNLKEKIAAEIVSNDVDSNWHKSYWGKFDLIIMRHVLEHFLNPVEALRKVSATLSKDGAIYIAVPDMMHPKGSLKNYWYRVVHTFYFSEQTLDRVASLANLVPIVIKSGEDSELWGIFAISDNDVTHVAFDNVYDRQLAVIRKHKRKTIYLNFKYNIKKLIFFFVPRKVKSKLKHI